MSQPISFDKERISLNLVKLKKGGKNFEINVDPDLAVKYKEGKEIAITDILKAEKIFSDAMKGLLAAEHDLKEFLHTEDVIEAAEKIIKEGEVQLTQEYRQQMRDAKRKQIMAIIHTNGIDPRTKAPHPLTRIENAFEEAKIHIDDFQDAKSQVQEILVKLRPILPISFEKKQLLLKIPAIHAPKCYATVKNTSTILQEDWQNDGSWHAKVELPAGLVDELYDKLGKMTHGDMESETLQ